MVCSDPSTPLFKENRFIVTQQVGQGAVFRGQRNSLVSQANVSKFTKLYGRITSLAAEDYYTITDECT